MPLGIFVACGMTAISDATPKLLARVFSVVDDCITMSILSAVLGRWPADMEETFEVCKDNLGRCGPSLGLVMTKCISSLARRCGSGVGCLSDVCCRCVGIESGLPLWF